MARVMRLVAGAVGLAVVLFLSGCGDAAKKANKEDPEKMKMMMEQKSKMEQKLREEAAKKALMKEGEEKKEDKKDDKKDK